MIEIHNLRKSFGEKILFENYQLSIPDGQFLVIHGRSGAGKTTLLNMIGGLEEPDEGSIVVDGLDISHSRNRRIYYRDKVGFLFQNFALIDNKTVRQNLELISKKDRTDLTIPKALSRVGLEGYDKKKVYTLSGGEQQRVALARLMLKKCDVILADEPTGSLDVENASKVMEILHEMNHSGKTIIMVTHSAEIVKNAEHTIEI
jgi:putative ABC transport system ATP-binding protein